MYYTHTHDSVVTHLSISRVKRQKSSPTQQDSLMVEKDGWHRDISDKIFDLTYDNFQTHWSRKKEKKGIRISPFLASFAYIPTYKYTKFRQQNFLGSGEFCLRYDREQKSCWMFYGGPAVVQGAIKQYFLLLLPPIYSIRFCRYRTAMGLTSLLFSSPKKEKRNHLSTVRTDIVNGPFPR
jgi:hypothetical protein